MEISALKHDRNIIGNFDYDIPLVSLEREYRKQSNGAAVNALRDVETAVMIELAMRYCEAK